MIAKRWINLMMAAVLAMGMMIALLPAASAYAAVTTETETVTATAEDGTAGSAVVSGPEEYALFFIPLPKWSGSYDKSNTLVYLLKDSYGDDHGSAGGIASDPSQGWVYVWGKGTHKITVRQVLRTSSGKKVHQFNLKTTVTLKLSSIDKDSLVTYPGQSTQLNTEYTTGDVTWKTTDDSVATVSAEGKVTAKKKGRCHIKATTTSSLSGKAVVLDSYVEVTSKTAYKALQEATRLQKAGNIRYSLTKRMKAKYRDCSSFVGRCYNKAGFSMGDKNWTLTAAEQAKWLKKKGKTVSTKCTSYTKLLPGDLIFYSKSSNLNSIYHVAMYAGGGRVINVLEMGKENAVRYWPTAVPSECAKDLKTNKDIIYIGRPC